MPHGHFHWNELMTQDAEGAKAFYSETIGWTFNDMPMPDGVYHVAMDGEKAVGGVFEMKGPEYKGEAAHWMSYLEVDDVDARVKKAVSAGAKIVRPAFDVPQVGRIALIEQPDGAKIGWITPADRS